MSQKGEIHTETPPPHQFVIAVQNTCQNQKLLLYFNIKSEKEFSPSTTGERFPPTYSPSLITFENNALLEEKKSLYWNANFSIIILV